MVVNDKDNTEKTNDTSKLTLLNYAGSGIGSFGLSFLMAIIGTYLTIYLTNVALLDIAAVSAIIAVSKAFDGISDVIIGNIINNTRSRFGRARAWLLRMSLPAALSMMLLFWMPPQMSGMLRYVYFFIIYNIANTVCLTFMLLSDMSLISLMTHDEKEHGYLANIMSFAKALSAIASAAAFIKLLTAFSDTPGEQNTQQGYTAAVTIFCIAMVVMVLIKVFTTKELDEISTGPGERRGLKEAAAVYGTVITDKSWMLLFIVQILVSIAMQTSTMGATYYALYTLGDMGQVGWIMSTLLITGIVILCIMPLFIGKISKKKLFIAGAVVFAAGSAGFALAAPHKTPMLIFNLVRGGGLVVSNAMLLGLVADVVTRIKVERGETVDGVGFAGVSAGEKIGIGIGSVIFGLVMSAAGFDGAAKIQPPEVAVASSWMFLWGQVLVYVIILAIMLFFFDADKQENPVMMEQNHE